MLTSAQLLTLKTDILSPANAAALGGFIAAIDDASIANFYNQLTSPDFWVWRSSVTQAEYVGDVSVDGTSWSWTSYIGRSQGERDGWRELFAETTPTGGIGAAPARSVNPSKANVRQGVADIFSGAGGTAQRTHLLAVSRRKSTRGETLFAVGTGSTVSPATMGFEGSITYLDVARALRNVGV